MNPADFWKPFEVTIADYDDLAKKIVKISEELPNSVVAWRGQVNASWALHSSLYRRVCIGKPKRPKEKDLHREEGEILANVHRWGLHVSREIGRLSILNQLAVLQHYGAPTRLVDVTFNPWIAAWFAVEQKYENADLRHEDVDARMFAIDVTDRLINEKEDLRDWEDELHRPWPKPTARTAKPIGLKEWHSQTYAWRPPHFESRIAAQNGGFIFGGVPATTSPKGPNQWPKGTNANDGMWTIDEVRASTSVALRPHKLDANRGGVTQNAVFTLRIPASKKAEIRERLQRTFGYQHSTIYPDYPGFAQFGTPMLRSY